MPNAKRKLSSSPKRKRGRPPKRSKLLAEEGLATGSRSKNKTKTKKTAIEPTASCSIYRNPKKRRIYYESCLNLPITFDSYVPSQQPKKNKDGDFPHQTFNVSVGDTIILHGDDSCKATPPKNQQGPTKKERWYPFIVPWMTCQVLSIYQQESKKKNKHGQPILEPCMFQVRYFNRKTESSLKEIPIAKDGDDDDNNRIQEMNCQKREGRTIAKERNIEEIYETDLCGDVFLRNILAKVYIVPNRNQLDSAGDSNRVVIPSPNAVEQHKEQDQRQNDTTPIEQFCQTCLVLMNKREYTLISASTGRCIYDEDLGKTIAQFIKKNITSTSNNQSDIDLFWFHRFCRGLKFLSNSDKTLSDGFIKSTLKFAHQRGGVREEDDPCDILESDSESKSTSSGNENEDDNVEDVELEVEEDEEEEEEEVNEEEEDNSNLIKDDTFIAKDLSALKPKRKRGRPPKRSKLLAEEGLATGSRSKNKTKTKKTAIEPTASCSIYRNPKKRRIYYESCLNLPITFDSYVPSQQPKKNKDGDFPHQTFNVSVGDTIILHGDDSCKATPPKNQQGPTKKERWYPFIVPWMTCQVLSIYQQESKKKNKHGQPILEPCMFQVRYFNRKTESSLKEIPIAKDGDDDDNNRIQEMNCQKREGRTIAKERNIEEIYETDLCGDVFLRNILAKVYIVPNRNQLDSAGDSNRVVIPSPNAVEQHKEQDQRQNDTTPIEQFCQTCLVLMNKREYTLISASTGRCIYDEDLGKTIAQFIKKNITSTSNNQSDIDLFWFHRFCRGLKFLSNSDKTLSDGFIKSTLKFAHQRGGVREEDDPCDILESDSESKSTSSGNENEDDNVEDVELEVEEDEEEEEEEQNEMIIHDVSSISSNEMTPFTPKKTKINSLPPTPCSVASTQIDRGWALELPFHVDVANRKAFFSEIHMKIPFENYIDCYSNTCNKDDLEWKFSIGDTVAIHIVEGSSKNDMFPYIVPWWPGEIVSFYLNLNSHDEALRLREKVVADENGLNGIKKFGRFSMEIRWLYRKTDIPGLAKVKSLMKAANGTEEVFETDCVDEVEISSLLGRVALFSYPNDERQNITLCSGLPVINFFCHQFFSVQRKSLMAIGSAENRVQRGMLYSKYMGRDSAIRAAHEKINPNSDKFVGLHKKDDWKQLFQDTFAKLTLAESSAIGGQDEHKIIGREKERHQISQFLTASILAAHDFRREELTNANKFVFFIGGAPGKFIDLLSPLFCPYSQLLLSP